MPSTPQDFKKKKTVTSASQWKKGATKAVELELPSGNVALIKPMRITTMLAEGFFPDSLRGIVMGKIADKDEKGEIDQKDLAGITEDPEQLVSMFATFDKVVVEAVIEPKVLPAPENDDDRDDEALYVDEVDLNDKVFIFQFCVGGTADLEKFRSEFDTAVGGVDAL